MAYSVPFYIIYFRFYSLLKGQYYVRLALTQETLLAADFIT